MIQYRSYYRTNDGRHDFYFSFIQQIDLSWRVYILNQPSYWLRDRSSAATHRLFDHRNRPYICWTTPLYEIEEAMNLASLWAEKTEAYILTGKSF